jgi:carbonic anhydrase/acetyltransferase-like protein (isoleucine patch superfamily)
MAVRSYKDQHPQLDNSVYVDDSAQLIGQVALGEDVSIWPLTVVRGDVHRIEIGARSNIQDGSVLHVSRPSSEAVNGYPLLIGREVTVGHQVTLHGCVIQDRVLIGMCSVVMDGAVIESDVILGAGSLVPPGKTLEKNNLYLGRPAQKIRALSTQEKQSLRTSAENYVALKNEYL